MREEHDRIARLFDEPDDKGVSLAAAFLRRGVGRAMMARVEEYAERGRAPGSVSEKVFSVTLFTEDRLV